MDSLLRDIRFGLKLLFKEKAFSATVLLTLAICIGANVAIFSVIQKVLLEPLPYDAPDRLVSVINRYPGAGVERAGAGAADYFYRRDGIAAFEEVGVASGAGYTVGEPGGTERVTATRLSPSMFRVLGTEAAEGRLFTDDEMDVGNHQKVVLTWSYWREAFGGAPDAVGRTLRVDGEPYTVVGILPEDFLLVGRSDTRFFTPIDFPAEARTIQSWHSNQFQMMARLAPGASVEQAQAQVDALNASMVEEWPVPNAGQMLADARFSTLVTPTGADMVRDVKGTLYMLWAGVGLVLLIGCVNIANLMAARSQVRLTELATKLALGASRGRVATQVMVEALVMGVVGSALGVALGALGLKGLASLGMDQIPRGVEVGIELPVLLFAGALGLVAALLFGAIPIMHAFRGDLSSVFRTEGRTGTSSRGAVLLRNGLVTGQVALAFLMLIGAGLMLASFRTALAVDPGFEPAEVLTASISLPSSRYQDAEARRQLFDELLRDVRSIPGVEAAGIVQGLPFSGNLSANVITPEGYVPTPGESLLAPIAAIAGPGYFEAMGIDLLQGRLFQESDDRENSRVMVVDEWLAERYWPDESPLGRRMIYGAFPGQDSVPPENLYTIVGVVETVKHTDLTADPSEHVGAYYTTYKQTTPGGVILTVRAGAEPTSVTPAVRRVLTGLDAELPLYSVETMEERISDSLGTRRTPMFLLLVFAGVALFLAAVGIYGALAYSVTQRTREMGIRMAMGSGPDHVFRLIVGQGLRMTAVGLAAGAVVALMGVRLLRSLLFGVEPTDPLIMLVVAALLGTVAMAACVVPAWRATRVDPTTALNYQ